MQDINNTFATNMKMLQLNDRAYPSNSAMPEGEGDSFDPFDRSLALAVDDKSDHNSVATPSDTGGFFRHPTSTSHSDSSIEEVARNLQTTEPQIPSDNLTLFIAMAIHPMTLEDYIWGENKSLIDEPQVRHCFHTSACARLLLAILNGVGYIHTQRIVHRDLKPSNIFLSVQQGPPSDFDGGGSVDITRCRSCADPPPTIRTFITPCIGDFGLAAEEATELPAVGKTLTATPMYIALVSSQQTQPGTTFYLPPTRETVICGKLDVYSLGVIAFELITRFGTKAERSIVLTNLGEGVYPDGFDDHELAAGIRMMLCDKREERWTTGQVQGWLERIRAEHS